MGNREEEGREFEPVDEYAVIMTLDEFREHVAAGSFIDYDGYGYLTKNGMSWVKPVFPSDLALIDTEDFTHIVWYNR